MDVVDAVKAVLGETLQLGNRAAKLDGSSRLFGSIAEFDSMAVVAVISGLEERFGIVVDDGEITAEIFETVGSLSQFVERKLEA